MTPGTAASVCRPVVNWYDRTKGDCHLNLRFDAARVTLEFGQKSARRLDSGRVPITESPLFGGSAQSSLF